MINRGMPINIPIIVNESKIPIIDKIKPIFSLKFMNKNLKNNFNIF